MHPKRDTLLFGMGIGLLVILVANWLKTGTEPPEAFVLLAAGLMGLPVFLRADEKHHDDKRDRGNANDE